MASVSVKTGNFGSCFGVHHAQNAVHPAIRDPAAVRAVRHRASTGIENPIFAVGHEVARTVVCADEDALRVRVERSSTELGVRRSEFKQNSACLRLPDGDAPRYGDDAFALRVEHY